VTVQNRLLVVACLLGVGLGITSPAFGHAVLERSQPAANASLPTSPREVALWFTETVAPAFSTVTVVDREGKSVGLGAVRVSGDQRGLIASLGEVPRGVYTVRWRVLSATDGHATSGFFVFAVGQSLPAGLASATQEAVRPITVVARWLGFLAALVLAGAAFFPVAVLRPAVARVDRPTAQSISREVSGRLRLLTLSAGLLLLVSGTVEFFLQAATLLDTSVIQLVARGMFWSFLWGATPGWSLLVRASMTVVLLLPPSPRGRILRVATLAWVVLVGGLAMLLGGPLSLASSLHMSVMVLISAVYGLIGVLAARITPEIAGVRVPEFPWAEPLAGAGLLAGITMTAHASGSGLIAIQADWLHLAAAALWGGELVCLVVIVRGAGRASREHLAQILVPRFSTVAGVCVGVLILTGLYAVWLHIPALRDFVITTYGQALGVKLLLVILILTLGALNRFVFVPRLALSASQSALHRLMRSMGGELTSAVVVVLAVAVMTSVPPANATLPLSAQKPLTLVGLAGDTRVSLVVAPAVAGWNRFQLEVTGSDRRPLPSDARVLLRLTKLDETLDPILVQPPLQGPGLYIEEGSELALPGWWDAEVIVRRRGQPDVSTSFPLRLGQPPPSIASPAAQRLLEQARSAAGTLHSWREVQQITDGNGGVVITRFEVVAPDRVHYQTSDGTDVVIVGITRALRSGSGSWMRDTLPQPVVAEGPLSYLRDAREIALGRTGPCDEESCQVVLWQWDRTITFAASVGMTTHRVYRILMVAPEHYMTLEYRDFGAPMRIELPP
jgi:copper transport protein